MSINLFSSNIGPEEIERCVEVLRSGWHTSGPINDEVESLISAYFGSHMHTALTYGCTGAMTLASRWFGIGKGDEVITSPMSFIATATSFMQNGAIPIFVDIDQSTGLICEDAVDAAITERTKAIWVVHLYGHMADMHKLRSIADKYGLWLVEDCAHAFESHRNGYGPGDLSDAACFSFYANKNISAGEGGAVISQNKKMIDDIKSLRRQGMSKTAQPGITGNMGYDIAHLGTKLNMSDINASLLPTQIKLAKQNRQTRDKIALRYYDSLHNLDGIDCVMPPFGCKSAWYTFPLLVNNRSSLIEKLRSNHIGHTIMYQTMESFAIFGKISCVEALEYSKRQLSIPCHHQLTTEEQSKIIETVVEWTEEQ